MAFTLSEMISGALRKAGMLRVSWTTSSGSASGAIDASLVGQTSDDDYKYAPWFCISTGSASGIAAGEMAEVSSYSGGTGLFTFPASAMSSIVEANTVYGVGTPEFRLKLLIELANDSLRSLGELDNADTTTITSSAGQTEYSIPTSIKKSYPMRVDIQSDISSSGIRNEWVTTFDWEYQPSSGGAAAKLVFPEAIPSGRGIRLWYHADHRRITAYNAAIDERVAPELAILCMVEKLYEYRNSMNRGSMEFDVRRWNDAKVQLAEARQKFIINALTRPPKLMIVGDAVADHLPYPYPYGPA